MWKKLTPSPVNWKNTSIEKSECLEVELAKNWLNDGKLYLKWKNLDVF